MNCREHPSSPSFNDAIAVPTSLLPPRLRRLRLATSSCRKKFRVGASWASDRALSWWVCILYNIWLVVWNIFYFPINIGNLIIPIDFHIFQRGDPTTNQCFCLSWRHKHTHTHKIMKCWYGFRMIFPENRRFGFVQKMGHCTWNVLVFPCQSSSLFPSKITISWEYPICRHTQIG